MEYKIGDIAKIFGMSSEGIRFHERKGLISGTRSANQYRIYGRKDLFTLGQCLRYSKMGFTLEQAKDLFFSKSIFSAIEMFDDQIQKEEKALKQEMILLSACKELKSQLECASLNEGRIIIEKVPGIYRISAASTEQNDTAVDESSYLELVTKLSPLSFSGRFFRLLEDNVFDTIGKRCIFIKEDMVKELDISLPGDVFYCPSCICATQMINIGATNSAEYDYSKSMLETLEREGIKPIGDIQVWYIFFSFKDGAEQRYCKIIVPINPER